ncbi:MAG: hypothetical protein ABIS07_05665 [Dokdonella sp.]
MNSKQLRRWTMGIGISLVVAGRAMAVPTDGGFAPGWGLFGSGKNIVPFDLGGGLTDVAADTLIGPDGAMYIVGTVTGSDGKNHFGIAKLDANGVPDPTFSGDGKAVSVEADVTATSAALTADGRLLVAGYKVVSGTDYDFIVCRFSASSGANLNFPAPTNTICITTVFLPGTQDIPRDIAIQADGKFVLAGTTGINSPTDRYAAFARFEANGQPDAGFGNIQGSNVSIIRNNGVFSNHDIRAVGIASNGKIVAIGSTTVVGSSDIGALMVRLNADGTQSDIGPSKEFTFERDNSNSRNTALQGMVLVDSPDSLEDDVVASGYVELTGGVNSGMIVKIKSNGVLASAFGSSSGFTSVTPAAGDLDFTHIARQSDGAFVVLGVRPASDALDLDVRRFTASGAVDASFGNNGDVTFDMGTSGQLDIGAGIVANAGGIYIAGYSYLTVSNYDFVAAKLEVDHIFGDGFESP